MTEIVGFRVRGGAAETLARWRAEGRLTPDERYLLPEALARRPAAIVGFRCGCSSWFHGPCDCPWHGVSMSQHPRPSFPDSASGGQA